MKPGTIISLPSSRLRVTPWQHLRLCPQEEGTFFVGLAQSGIEILCVIKRTRHGYIYIDNGFQYGNYQLTHWRPLTEEDQEKLQEGRVYETAMYHSCGKPAA